MACSPCRASTPLLACTHERVWTHVGAMGSGQSSPAGGSASAAGGAGRPSRVGSLAASGRYASFSMPNGATVHVLGVFPASTLSEEEAADLVAAAKPTHLYLDVPPEWTATLAEEVAAGRHGDWRIPDASPRFRMYPGAGVLGSILLRNALADNEMAGLMAAELYGPYKAALAAAAATTGASPTLLSYPFDLGYNNGEMLDRPAELRPFLLGDNSFASTTVHALVGNGLAIMLGEPGAAEFAASVPADRGYFTREEVDRLRKANRATVNTAVARGPGRASERFDVESDLSRREGVAREAGKTEDAASFQAAAVRSQLQVRGAVVCVLFLVSIFPRQGG